MTRTLRRLVAGLVLCAAPAPAFAPAFAQTTSTPVRLPRLFADGMVLQRDARLPVWGWAAPGAPVTVTFRGRTARAVADTAGAWRVTLDAAPAGGPHVLTVRSGAARVDVRDVLVGDVWVASGQSNMEWPLVNATDGPRDVAAAHDPQLRQFKVPTSWSWTPEADLAGGSWAGADPQHAGAFSAVGYHFARELRRTEHVPIGIVNATWGGSAIAPWTSRAALRLDSAGWAAVVQREQAYQAGIRDTLRARIGELPTVDAGMAGGRAVWADPALDDAAWPRVAVPGGWEQSGYPGLDGVGWLRTTFTLTADEAARGARLVLGPVDDDDVTWVNGVEVGRTARYDLPRTYDVPATALRAGRNVLAIRVVDGAGGGGVMGGAGRPYLEVGGARRSLAGQWAFRVGVVSVGEDGQHVNKIPAVLYNRMLHPLLPFPIRGVIWYQGESNANDDAQAGAYRDEFATLIRSWRAEWRATAPGGRDFPFLWVQLPNFGAVDTVPPTRAAWATIRESQAAALALPRTGQAVAIEQGDPGDIHPREKREVGRRLALAARAVAYGRNVAWMGPTLRRHTVRDGRVVLEFAHASGGLVAHGDSLAGFAVAGADRRFVWARARIEGDRVLVWSDAVREPVAVRYAWGNSPRAPGLFDRAGLPAAPFRTDRW